LKKGAIDLTTSQPTPFHDHVTLCVHQEIHLEKGQKNYKNKREKREERKEMSKGHTISILPHLPLHLPVSTPSTPTSTPLPPPSKRKSKEIQR